MKILNFRDFTKKYNSKKDTMDELELQRVYNFFIYPRNSKIYANKKFVNIDNGSARGSHWTFFIKGNKSY